MATVNNNGEAIEETELVDLSLSGTSFTIRRNMLTEHKWILSKLLDEDIPWALHHNGRYFIGADPVAFRWVLHFARYQSLPATLLQSMTEMEAIRELADFLCFETMHEYVNSNITTCLELERRVEELEKKIARADQVHKKDIAECKKTSNDEITKVKKVHDGPLKQLIHRLDGMDGVKFSYDCRAVVLWNADSNVDYSTVKCPQCGDVFSNHGSASRLTGRRSDVNTSSRLIRW